MDRDYPSSSGITFSKVLKAFVGLFILGVSAYIVYVLIRWSRGLSTPGVTTDQVPEPVDGRSGKVIPAGQVPLGVASDYGLQFWAYIKDWDYGFGKEKLILKRVDPANGATMNPKISLHPTDNSLNVTVSIYPNEQEAATGAQVSATGDSFTCTVENVPLQAWFSISVTVFQRNLDIYINGRLVKSCVLPGVPRPAVGDITLGSSTEGFSGTLCTLKSFSNALGPQDASSFFDKGTPCTSVTNVKTDTGRSFTLFGYTFKFSIFNQGGEEIRNYSF
jgi:hypothetical protein